MARKRTKSKQDAPNQRARFIETAKQIGVDEDPEAPAINRPGAISAFLVLCTIIEVQCQTAGATLNASPEISKHAGVLAIFDP